MDCSAKTLLNCDKILLYAERFVVYPIAPLLDRITNVASRCYYYCLDIDGECFTCTDVCLPLFRRVAFTTVE